MLICFKFCIDMRQVNGIFKNLKTSGFTLADFAKLL